MGGIDANDPIILEFASTRSLCCLSGSDGVGGVAANGAKEYRRSISSK